MVVEWKSLGADKRNNKGGETMNEMQSMLLNNNMTLFGIGALFYVVMVDFQYNPYIIVLWCLALLLFASILTAYMYKFLSVAHLEEAKP